MDRIFSGEASRELWEKINAITDPEAHDAVYALGCKLQEFESFVRKELGQVFIRVVREEQPPTQANTQYEIKPKCNCMNHRPGALTAGWVCPVHGQQF